jgi:transcriptional regulator with XRE-family HTH domain
MGNPTGGAGFSHWRKGGPVISRIEGGTRMPSRATAFACALVFGATLPELFPDISTAIHEDVRRRANELYEELQGNPSKVTRHKLDFLELVLARLEGTPSIERWRLQA